MCDTDKTLDKSSAGERSPAGHLVSTFYKKKLRQKRLIDYSEMVNDSLNHSSFTENPKDNRKPGYKKTLLKRGRKLDATKNFSDCDDQENDDIFIVKHIAKKQKVEQSVSEYEQKVLQNIKEKNQLLLKLNFLGPKKSIEKPKRKIVKRVYEMNSTRVLRQRNLKWNVYRDQDTD